MIPPCRECGREFGHFDAMIPVLQMRMDGEGVEPSGYAHLWHFKSCNELD